MNELPDSIRRNPTKAGRESLAKRLRLTIDPYDQDWEWTVASADKFQSWLAVYRTADLSDDERFSLMEMLIQCVDELATQLDRPAEDLQEWKAVETILLANVRLHASTVHYWCDFDSDEQDGFAVTRPMRWVWQAIQADLG